MLRKARIDAPGALHHISERWRIISDWSRQGSRPRADRGCSRARSLICALAVDRLGTSVRGVSRRQNLASAVSKLTQRGRTDDLNE